MAAQLPTETKVKLFKTNRDNFYEQFPAADLVLLVGGKEKHRNADTEVEFRQDSDFMYVIWSHTGQTNSYKVFDRCDEHPRCIGYSERFYQGNYFVHSRR